MFYTKKEKNTIAARQDAMFDTIMNYVDMSMRHMRNEMLDIIMATAAAGKITPKRIADNYTLEKLRNFAEELHGEVERRIEEEIKRAQRGINEDVKNVYTKAKTCKRGQKCK